MTNLTKEEAPQWTFKKAYFSVVGTVTAIAVLAATLFMPVKLYNPL